MKKLLIILRFKKTAMPAPEKEIEVLRAKNAELLNQQIHELELYIKKTVVAAT